MNDREINNVCNKVAEAVEMLYDEGFETEIISRKAKTERQRSWKVHCIAAMHYTRDLF